MKKKRIRSRRRFKRPHKFELYEASVQDAESEAELMAAVYEDEFDQEAHLFREDFCATFFLSAEWIKRDPKNEAICVDIDSKPLDWGKKRHFPTLTRDQQKRIHLVQKDVMKVEKPKVDIIGVCNFSTFFIKKRNDLVDYFKIVRRSLKLKGVFAMDIMGGIDVGQENRESRKFTMPDGRRVTYIWEETDYNPITHEAVFYIHYRFSDGTMMKKTFTYPWRVWSIPEIRDAMEDAGFSRTCVYWEGDDDDGGGNGEFSKSEKEENCDVWIAYVVGVKE